MFYKLDYDGGGRGGRTDVEFVVCGRREREGSGDEVMR